MSDPYRIPGSRKDSPLALVNGVRQAVSAWRDGYPGVSDTTRRLLEHWFLDEHQTADGDRFAYFYAQREAIETIVYLHEVARLRTTAGLIATFAAEPVAAPDLPYPRYFVKMATGSGKTKVMALAITWAYFHSLREEGSGLSPTSLVVAPNLIVYERLRTDFEAAAVFGSDPMVPPEWRADFDLQVVLRNDPVPFSAAGVLCLTNVQQLYLRQPPEPANPVDALLGPRPPTSAQQARPLLDRLAERERVLVVNDEAHHLHDRVKADTGEPVVAMQSLARLDETAEDGVCAQLDFSATPRNPDGVPFPEVVVDYPLGEAIDDGIVKRPTIGELRGALETPSDDASIRYRQQIDAGVVKWREAKEKLEPAGHKPLLFVMAESTDAADQIATYLETLGELSGKVLTIHVNMGGANRFEIRTSELEDARRWAREADSPDNPYAAIVSVLMLREGWDVRNVSVIVPLRPYTAAAKILPEQTLGRGLRRMTPPGSGVDERVVVIEHEAFRELWDDLIEEEGLDIDREAVEDVELPAKVIAVEPGRVPDFDIEVPALSRRLARSPSALDRLGVDDLPERLLDLPDEVEGDLIEIISRDLRTGEVVDQAEYPIPRADDPGAVLSWYTNQVQHQCRLTGQFHLVAPLVKGYVETRAFGQPVAFTDATVLRALASPAAREAIVEVLRRAVDRVSLADQADVAPERPPRLLSDTRPFLWSKETAEAERSIFPVQPCDSGLEVRFVGFADRCTDVAAFAKLAPASRISMEYRNEDGRMAFYYPDFVVRMTDGDHHLIETKGHVDLDVPAKDRRAAQWALDATMVSGTRWQYHRVDERLFDEHAPALSSMENLLDVVRARRRASRLATVASGGKRSPEELLELMDKLSERTRSDPPDVDAELRAFRERGDG